MRALLLALPLLFALPAGAAPGDAYRGWLLDLKRTPDAKGRAALAKKAPDQARTWLYTYVFDLGTPGVPEAEKARIVGVAEGLLAGLDDSSPAVLLDRGKEGTLEATATQVRAATDRAVSVPQSDPLVVTLPTVATDGLTARATVYGLLSRAQRRQRRLGGRRQGEVMRLAAQRLAADLAQLTGDLGPWRATHADGAPPVGAGLALESEHAGLRAWSEGKLSDALQRLDQARSIAERAQGATARTALLRGAMAEVLLALGRPAEAVVHRDRQVRELAQLPHPWLVAHARVGLARAHLAAKAPAQAGAVARQLTDAAARTEDPMFAQQLVELADALALAGRARVDAGQVDAGEPLLAAADALFKPLRDQGAIDRAVPTAHRNAAAHDRAVSAGKVAVSRAAAASARGQLAAALKAAEAAVAVFPEDARAEGWAAVATHALAVGELAQAADAATTAEPALRPDPLAHAAHRLLQAQVRVRQGRFAPAFALANAGLTTLREAGLAKHQASLRGQLHHLAALALYGAGHRAEARKRLAYALGVNPSAPVAVDLAAARLADGDLPGARAALRAFESTDETARVVSACLAVRAGQPEAGLRALQGLRAAHPRNVVQAFACQAVGYARSNATGTARRVLAASRIYAEAPQTDPADAYAWYAAEASIATGDAAETARTQALAHWRKAQVHEVALLSDQRPSWLGAPDALVAALTGPEALGEAAAWQDRQQADWRPGPDPAGLQAALASLRGHQAAYARAQAEPEHRKTAAQALDQATTRLEQARVARREADPRWARLVDPQPVAPEAWSAQPGTARLYYRCGAQAGEVVLLTPGAEPKRWPLPGQAALTRGVEAVQAALNAAAGPGPYDTLWTTLKGASKQLAPWADDPALDGLTLHVWADGPLQAFPFEILVLARPKTPGAPPTFVASRWPVIHRATLDEPVPAGAGEGFAKVGARAADDKAVAHALAGAETRLKAATVAEALNARYAWLAERLPAEALTAPVAAEGVLFAGWPPPKSPLLRWAGLRWVLTPAGLGPATPSAAGALWARLAGRPPVFTLHYTAGTETTRGAFTAEWLPDVGADLALPEAVAQWRAQAVASRAVVDGRPAFHPLHWARWRLVHP